MTSAFTIPPEEMTKLISWVILQALTPERREAMLSEAIKGLLTPERRGFGNDGKTPMQQAFDSAAYDVVRDLMREYLKTPEMQIKIGAMVQKALTKALDDDKVSSAFAGVLIRSFDKVEWT